MRQETSSKSLVYWLNDNRDMCIEALRIYLGIGLLLKGIAFITNKQLATEYANQIYIPFFNFLSIHLILIIHIAGGIFLALGFLTRIAALIQVPILVGAIFLIHWHEGIFDHNENLEFVLLVLFLLLVFVGYGGGRFSVDGLILRRKKPTYF